MLELIAFIVGVSLVAYGRRHVQYMTDGKYDKSPNFVEIAKTAVPALLAGLTLGGLAGGVVIVPAGHRVVVFDSVRGVKPNALGEGLNFVTPFVQSPILVDVRVAKAEFETSAASKDLQDVTTKVALNFHLTPEAAPNIYKLYGLEYAEKVVHPAVQESVKAVTSQYTAEELITRREEVRGKIQEQLSALIAPASLKLDATYITDFSFSKDFSQAIESKQIAEQSALKASRDLDRIKIEAEQKIASARAEAASLNMQKTAISPELLKLRQIEANVKAIEKWDGKMPQTILGGGTMPFINVSEK